MADLSVMSGTVAQIVEAFNDTEWQKYGFWDNVRLAMAPNNGPPIPYLTVLGCMCFPFLLLVLWELTHVSLAARSPRACRRLGLKPGAKSNLSDQYDERFSPQAATKTDVSDWRIKALFVYPIKSCAPVELESTPVLRTGLQYDRQFCFAQLEKQPDKSYKWKFITQRQFPKLALVKPQVWIASGDSSKKSRSGYEKGTLVVNFPAPDLGPFINRVRGIAPKLVSRDKTAIPTCQFRVPLLPTKEERKKLGLLVKPVNVWADCPDAIDLGPLISTNTRSDLASVLGVKNTITLFCVLPQSERPVVRKAPTASEIGYDPIIGFPDSYPLHIDSITSVQSVAAELPPSFPGKLSALRFRANIYIAGPPAFAEDKWTNFSVIPASDSGKQLPFAVRIPTTRCSLPNVDPETGTTVPYPRNAQTQTPYKPGDDPEEGEAGSAYNEPLKTLKRLRCIEEEGKPCLGMQMLPAKDPEGHAWELSVGDRFVAR